VALCGTFCESRGHACDLQAQIRSKNHRRRRRDRALPKALNLLVEGSIPSGLTIPRHSSRYGSPGGISGAPSPFGLGLTASIPSGLTIPFKSISCKVGLTRPATDRQQIFDLIVHAARIRSNSPKQREFFAFLREHCDAFRLRCGTRVALLPECSCGIGSRHGSREQIRTF
jgi:hypothetical protein